MPDSAVRGIPALSDERLGGFRMRTLQASAKGKNVGFSGTYAQAQHPDSWLFFVFGSHTYGVVRDWTGIDAGYDWWQLGCGRACCAQIFVGRPNGRAKAASYSRTVDFWDTPTHGYAEVLLPGNFDGRLLDADVNWSWTTSAHTLYKTFGPYDRDALVVAGSHAYQDHSGVLTLNENGQLEDVRNVNAGSGFVRMKLGVLPKGRAVQLSSYDTYRHGIYGMVLA